MLFVHVTGTGHVESWEDLRELLLVLGLLVGQSAIIAIPAALSRWRKMSNPLLECVMFGALAAPGPLGYFAILMLGMLGVAAVAKFFIMLAALGAIGGFAGWAVATSFGRQPNS